MAVRKQMHETMRERRLVWRRRRLIVIIGRFVVLLLVVGLLAWWFGGGRWGVGFLLVGGAMLVIRLALFASNGRRFERKFGGPARPRP